MFMSKTNSMKKTIISFVLLLVASCGWAQKVWKNPTSFYVEELFHTDYKVNEVEFTDKETIVHLRALSNGDFSFHKETFLMTPDGKQYLITNGNAIHENEVRILLGEKYKPTGPYTYVALHFEPLPYDVERFHLMEGSGKSGKKIWNITEGKPKDMSDLFNSNWRNDQTGDWILSLYADNAVYNSKVWKYESKSEKSVVLSDGKEKVTIAIGKEKNGKRQFSVNGQKVTLSGFGSILPAYPTKDDTEFSTELYNGEVAIAGWIKDFPKEFAEKKIHITAKVNDILTGEIVTESGITIDSLGQFSIKVKLNGVQSVLFEEETDNGEKVFATDLVLQPGKQCYMVHDWKNGSCLFMGEDARLQNELQSNPCTMDWIETRKVDYKEKNYKATVDKLNDIIAKTPTLSKRYRDYMNDNIRFYAAQYITKTFMPEKAVPVAEKYADVNPAMPLSLSRCFNDYIDSKLRFYIYTALEKNSGDDRDLSKVWVWKQMKIAEKKNICRGTGVLLINEIQKIAGSKTFEKFRDIDMEDAYNEWASDFYKVKCNVIDSLFSNQLVRDYCRARILGKELAFSKNLRNGASAVIDEIKNDYFKQQVVGLKNYYVELVKQNEEDVKKAIAPSSDFEGMTDGKAIIDKIIEPYKGKIVYMDLWGTWCQPCINAIKASPKLKEAVKDHDMVYVYFACRSEEKEWKIYIAELGLTKPNYINYNLPESQQKAVMKYLKVDGFPFFVLFDKHGNMEKLDRDHFQDVPGFKKKIDELSKK